MQCRSARPFETLKSHGALGELLSQLDATDQALLRSSLQLINIILLTYLLTSRLLPSLHTSVHVSSRPLAGVARLYVHYNSVAGALMEIQ